MPLYRIANLILDSAIALPAVPIAPASRRAGWTFVVSRRRAVRRRPAWYHHETVGRRGPRSRSLARDGDRHLIRFHRQATFEVSFATRRIRCHPCASAPLDDVRQLLLGQVLPLVFAEAGALALHASAVRLPEGVVLFAGRTRRGKSTLACALAARGYPLVADDCAIVTVDGGVCRVRPLDIGVRLLPDASRVLNGAGPVPGFEEKLRLPTRELELATERQPAPLHRIYLLDSAPAGQPTTISRMPAADAAVALMVGSFQIGMDDPAQVRRTFDLVSTVCAHVPVRRLAYPRGWRRLPEVLMSVVEDA